MTESRDPRKEGAREKRSGSVVRDALKGIRQEILRKWIVSAATAIVVGLFGILFGLKSCKSTVKPELTMCQIEAYLPDSVRKGDTIELYPPSIKQSVGDSRVLFFEVPFDEIANTNLQLRRLNNNGGKIEPEILSHLDIGDEPKVRYVLEKPD